MYPNIKLFYLKLCLVKNAKIVSKNLSVAKSMVKSSAQSNPKKLKLVEPYVNSHVVTNSPLELSTNGSLTLTTLALCVAHPLEVKNKSMKFMDMLQLQLCVIITEVYMSCSTNSTNN